MNMNEQLMNGKKQREQIMSEMLAEKEKQDLKLDHFRKEASDLAAKIDGVEFPNRWDEIVTLRNNARRQLGSLKKRVQPTDDDKLQVLEARQDITMWVAQGFLSSNVIERDIKNLDVVRLKAWLSIDQNNLGKKQKFDTEPLLIALCEALFPEEWEVYTDEIIQCDAALEKYRKLSGGLSRKKESLQRSELKHFG
ncbi:hypothetical protein V3H41_17805 [Vibrio parahaemolyticus]|uniref:hypothetical protein n=1 Tax=Vibrio parahaemolyticus TaxID=670 RepID=UPI000A5EB715|nr:hypothetical protein [Vibrio parahaemolyticus]EHK7403230.1 hypothetical protein [Vibrio parahaemolyticus]EHR5477391.1 hypothetical protein [Vibrio parahaemolyticus]